ncbi:MAG: hypothetical protein U0531_13775 [Dehalococcoidia bacterium]
MERWPALTDTDILASDGHVERLAAVISRRAGVRRRRHACPGRDRAGRHLAPASRSRQMVPRDPRERDATQGAGAGRSFFGRRRPPNHRYDSSGVLTCEGREVVGEGTSID